MRTLSLSSQSMTIAHAINTQDTGASFSQCLKLAWVLVKTSNSSHLQAVLSGAVSFHVVGAVLCEVSKVSLFDRLDAVCDVVGSIISYVLLFAVLLTFSSMFLLVAQQLGMDVSCWFGWFISTVLCVLFKDMLDD